MYTDAVLHQIDVPSPALLLYFLVTQANIYPSAQRHKLLSFSGYQRKAAVLVPSDEEWKRRLRQKEQSEGAVLPEISLLKSKGQLIPTFYHFHRISVQLSRPCPRLLLFMLALLQALSHCMVSARLCSLSVSVVYRFFFFFLLAECQAKISVQTD